MIPAFNVTFLFVCVLGLISLNATEAAPTYRYHSCSNSTAFNSNSTYRTNLNFVLSSLSSNASRDDGFYSVSAGAEPPNVAYGLFLCRGDVTAQVCNDCVVTAVNETAKRCPGLKDVIIWYDECMVRYSNQSFFSTVQEQPVIYMWNSLNITEPLRFNELVMGTMNAIATQAADGPSVKKYFVTKEESFTSVQTLYNLVQCTQDLSSADCSKCLGQAISYLPRCCSGKQGGRVLLPNCNLRYEVYPFYDITPAPAPMLPPPPPPSSQTSSQGKL